MAKRRAIGSIPSKTRLKHIADALWSQAVRKDWAHRCAVCGSGTCEAHHLLPRQHEATRYDLRNGIALCSRHHQFDPDVSPHQNAAGWLRWLRETHPARHAWYVQAVDTGDYRRFDGTKTAVYYLGLIGGLRPFVEEDDFVRICGTRLVQRLDAME